MKELLLEYYALLRDPRRGASVVFVEMLGLDA